MDILQVQTKKANLQEEMLPSETTSDVYCPSSTSIGMPRPSSVYVEGAIGEDSRSLLWQSGNGNDGQVLQEPTAPTVQEELGRGKRKKRKPARYIDPQPVPPPPVPALGGNPATNSNAGLPTPVFVHPEICRTEQNGNGLYREYFSRPSFVPDESTEDFLVERGINPDYRMQDHRHSDLMCHSSDLRGWFWPFLSATSFRLMNWFWGGSATKSIADLQTLVDQVLKAEDFSTADLKRFNVRTENRRLDEGVELSQSGTEAASILAYHDGWRKSSVDIILPDRCKHASEDSVPRFTISGLHHRSVVQVITAAFRSQHARRYHYMPYRQYWQPRGDECPQRVYDELYASEAWWQKHSEVQGLPRDPEDRLERAIAAIMLWSDSTHLTNFGDASLWPLYMYFGNQSKYERSKPSSHSCHHLAYLPKLPDNISDSFKEITNGKPLTTETLAHCRRELLHALLAKIFDGEFLNAYDSGLVIECADGIKRRIFPRFFTYSADYPEKVMLATTRSLSKCPCPRCLVKKTEAHRLGTKENEATVDFNKREDTHAQRFEIKSARSFIWRLGCGVKSKAVEAIIGLKSLVPIINTFSTILWPRYANFYSMFVVDFLHEFELGLWKNSFIHLIRILTACGQDRVASLNERYRAVQTFGRDTIRKFTTNASSLKRLAARDYENLLLCSLPVFEGLFPEAHDEIIQDLLFSLLFWHSLAKLRLHTENSLENLKITKRRLGVELSRFQNTVCKAYETRELPTERIARERRASRKLARQGDQIPHVQENQIGSNSQTAQDSGKGTELQRKGPDKSLRKKFNLNTYKAHAPEHYYNDIQQFGTVDSYSTQIGEREHRKVKIYYARTNKNRATEQMTKIERREHLLRGIQERDLKISGQKSHPKDLALDSNCRLLPYCRVEDHHHISNSRNDGIYLPSWLRENIGNSEFKHFRNNLKDHLLGRLLDSDEFTDADRSHINVEYDRIYAHKILRVNYTTYDGQRKQDTLNPTGRADVMIMAPSSGQNEDGEEEIHPYWYARILGIFHANICHTGYKSVTGGVPQRVEFLWVKWFTRTFDFPSGWKKKRLHAIQFVAENDYHDSPVGFLDPSQVVRGVHLLPAFKYGKKPGPFRNRDEWHYYYVNSFVDRDMFMRYHGGGVGHTALQLANYGSEALESPLPGFVEGEALTEPTALMDEENDEIYSDDEDRQDESDEEKGTEDGDTSEDSDLEEE